MSRRSRRLQRRATQDAEEGKTEDRRLSAGGVLGLDAPAGTPNLRTAQVMSAAEAAAATLDAYNAEEHVNDGNTIDEKNEGSAGSAREEHSPCLQKARRCDASRPRSERISNA